MRPRVGILCAALFASAGCAPEDEPPVAVEVLPDGVEMAIINMDHYLTRTGVRRARLAADTAQFRADGEIHLRPVTLTFYDEEGRELSVVTGDFGVFNETTENMEAHGSVVALDRRDDQRLETTHIRYVSEEDRLFGDEPFTLFRDNGRTVLEGSSFETDPGLSSILMFDSSGRSQQSGRPAPRPVTQDTIAPSQEPAPTDSGTVAAPPDSGAVIVTQPDSSATPPDSAGTAPPDTTSARR